MLRRNNQLITQRGIVNNPLITCASPAITQDNTAFMNWLLPPQLGVPETQRRLPTNSPFEMHPYLKYVSQEFFEKYIIGTFPPISYVIDELLNNHGLAITHLLHPNGAIYTARPDIPFFHGNLGLLWMFILTQAEIAYIEALPNRESIKEYLINWLNKNEIIYSDIIKSTQRILDNGNYTSGDNQLHNICINSDLICHILSNPNAKYLMFNTSQTFGRSALVHINRNDFGLRGQVNVNNDANSFDLFIRGCQELGLKVEFRINHGPTPIIPWTELNAINAVFINQNFKNKIAFELRLTTTEKTNKIFLKSCCTDGNYQSREFYVFTPLSPAAVDRGMSRRNRIFIRWTLLHNAGVIDIHATRKFLKDVFSWFKGNDFDEIYNLNVH
jgi:hypothetical protein